MRLPMIVCAVIALGCAEEAPAPGPIDQAPRQEPAPPAPSCSTDVDCETCSTRQGCACVLAPNPRCGPMEHPCFAPPCIASSASCWDGRCVMRHAAAGPCARDSECEVRADDCQCDLFAALVTSRTASRCPGQSCGTRPAPTQYRARCDPAAHRCVLERNR